MGRRSLAPLLLFAGCVFAAPPWAQPITQQSPELTPDQRVSEASRFERTVDALVEADDELRHRFANLALMELAEVYLAEADLARSEARDSEKSARLRGWSRAVERYAEQLLLVREDIELGFPVELRSYAREVPSITVAGRTVFLAHPRRSQQGAFEQSVLTQFCTGSTCTALTVENEAGDVPIPMSPGLVNPEWAFSAQGPVCRYRGLSLQFSAAGQLPQQRALCQQLMQESALLATELAWQRRHGVVVDWDSLVLRATPQRPEHVVLLNNAGDSLLITLPLIYSTDGLVKTLVPWLQAYGNRDGPPDMALQAGDLGWE